jgi:hypothetical protein
VTVEIDIFADLPTDAARPPHEDDEGMHVRLLTGAYAGLPNCVQVLKSGLMSVCEKQLPMTARAWRLQVQ